MNFSFKALSRTLLLVAAAAIASCAPTSGPSETNDITLSDKAFALTKINTADTSIASLICGCPFNIEVVSYTGDTSVIHYSIPLMGNTLSSFRVILSGDAGVAPRTYTSELVVKGGEKGFLDTINTTYVVE